MPGNDDAQVKIISQIQVDTTPAVKSLKDLAMQTKQSGDIVAAEAKRIAKETAAAWKQKEAEDAKIAKQIDQMWAQYAKEQAKRDQERLKHGMDVERQLAAEEKKRAQEIEQMWAQKARDDERIAKEMAQMWEQYERELEALDKRRLQHGLDVERQLAVEEKKRAQEAAAEEQRVAKEIEQMWTQRAAEEQRIAKETDAMWAEKARQDAQRDKERLAHGLAVERQLAAEAKARAQAELNAQRQADKEASFITGAQNSLPGLNAQLAEIKSRLSLEHIGDMTLKSQADTMREQVKLLQQRLKEEGSLTKEEALQVQQLRAQAKELSANVTAAAADQRSTLGGQFLANLNRRAGWLLTGAGLFGTAAAAKSIISDTADIEMKMIELGRVMEDPLFKMDAMRKAIFDLGEEFGFSFQQVQDIMLRWAQAGYDAKQSIELTRASLLALNTAELDASNATESLIGIMKQWGLESDQLVSVIDKINKVADDYSVTSQDLVDGLLRSSGAARNANMTFEQTVGLLTAMKEASGRSGAEVGNALNSIISFMQKQKFLEILEQNGIPAFADAAKQKLRPTFDIISALADNWDHLSESVKDAMMEQADAAGLFSEELASATGTLEQWTDLQKRDIMQTGAGIYRRNYLIALLRNFAQVQQVINTQESAFGYSQRENARTMEAYTKKVQQMKTAWQELLTSLAADGGVMDALKGIANVLRGVADGFNNLSPGMKTFITAMLGIVGALSTLSLASKATTGLGIIGLFQKAWEEAKKLKAAIDDAGGAMTALSAFGASSGPILLLVGAFAALAGVIVTVNNHAQRLQRQYQETKDKADALIRASEAEAKTHADNAAMVMKLADQYRALEKAKSEQGANLDDIANKQEQIALKIEDALGRETAARLKASNYSKEVADDVAKAEQEKVKAINETVQKQIDAYRKDLQAQAEAAAESIKVLENQLQGWESYLTFWEKTKLFFLRIWTWLKEGWANFNADMALMLSKWQGMLANAFEHIGMNDLAKQFRKSSETNMIDAYNLRADVDMYEKELADAEAKAAEPAIARQRKLIADLREEIVRLGEDAKNIGAGGGSGSGDNGSGGQFGTGSSGNGVSSIVDDIVAETEAIGKKNDALQREINLIQQRIAYNTRDGATSEELAQADKDRAALLDLLAQRQNVLHMQADAARAAYNALAAAQAKVNTSTEEGQKAFKDAGSAMDRMLTIIGNNSAEWWSIEKQKNDTLKANNAVTTETLKQLDDLKQKYDDGLISLEAYIAGLAKLQNQSGLTADATKKLNDELAKANASRWQADITKALNDKKAQIQAQIDALQAVLDQFDKAGAAEERTGARSALSKALGDLMGTPVIGSMPTTADVSSLISNVMAQFAKLDYGKLSPEEFAKAVGADLNTLRNFAHVAQGYLDGIGDTTAARLKEIEQALKDVDTWLQGRLAELQAQLDAMDAQDKQEERDKATEQHNQKMAELNRQLNDVLYKDDLDSAFKAASLKRQIADEEKAWAEQQGQWQKEDKRAEIQAQMEAARQEAENRKKALEDERASLQAQQQALTTALQALLNYINAETTARKDALKAEQKDLEETSKSIDETLKGVNDKVLGTLANMAAQQPEFFKNAQGLVQKIIEGINSEAGNLQSAVDNINSIINSIQYYNSGSGGMPDWLNVDPAKIQLPPPPAPPKMAEGGYVKARPGGIIANIGEGGVDEYVQRVDRIQPMINMALQSAIASLPAVAPVRAVDNGDIIAAIERGMARAIQNATFYAEMDVSVDGVVERKLVKFVGGLGHVFRG